MLSCSCLLVFYSNQSVGNCVSVSGLLVHYTVFIQVCNVVTVCDHSCYDATERLVCTFYIIHYWCEISENLLVLTVLTRVSRLTLLNGIGLHAVCYAVVVHIVFICSLYPSHYEVFTGALYCMYCIRFCYTIKYSCCELNNKFINSQGCAQNFWFEEPTCHPIGLLPTGRPKCWRPI